ncbi:unnamed protein product [Parascedosporium putredinis]|uniref:Uncharacterized protein n=1 Tax=Parascedosporium putredinis TaxID=1442378 RepID=A0A9P1MG60_9PEZI|nr:unnamed protein product [Parascedosporium putredinis]CAI8004836.1 unnamed protein product [Parascedosporium putredinis]
MALPGIASSSAAAPLTRDEERAIALIQIVALLKVLHQQPLDSTRHEDDLEIVNKEGYELTFQREQELTGLLAFLSNTKYDNQRIPAIAVQESRPERDIENEDKIRSNVYDAILNMCNTRIIERLDPGKMNQKTTVEKKEPMKERLEAAIDLLKEDNPRDENLRDAAEDFKARARLAIRGIAAWEKHQVMADMRALVDRFYELNEMPKFVDIEAGNGPRSLEDLEGEFSECVKEILGATSVHAEVQILAYCDKIAMKNPRVVCSSKKACYLCDQLIQHRGTTFTRHAHNRLYPKWRLPIFDSGDITAQFTETLRNVAKDSVEKMLKTQKRIVYHGPAESVCHTLTLSTTTIAPDPSTTPEASALRDGQARAPDAEELEEPRSQNLDLQGSPVDHNLEDGTELVAGDVRDDAEVLGEPRSQKLDLQGSPVDHNLEDGTELVAGEDRDDAGLEGLIEPTFLEDRPGGSRGGEDAPAVHPPSAPRLESEDGASELEDERNSIAASELQSSCAASVIDVSASTASSEEQLSSLSECEKRPAEAGARKLYRGNTIYCEDPEDKLDLVFEYPQRRLDEEGGTTTEYRPYHKAAHPG